MLRKSFQLFQIKQYFSKNIRFLRFFAIFSIFALSMTHTTQALAGGDAVSSKPRAVFTNKTEQETSIFGSYRSIPASVPIKTGASSLPPSGYINFCANNPESCDYSLSASLVELTDKRIEQLKDIQWEVNKTIEYVSDEELYGKSEHWAFPVSAGDCEDIVLEKRRRLIALGWPADALLPTVTITENGKGIGHLVLMVITSSGDYVLDLGTTDIQSWKGLDYKWISRKAPGESMIWKKLKV